MEYPREGDVEAYLRESVRALRRTLRVLALELRNYDLLPPPDQDPRVTRKMKARIYALGERGVL